MSFCLAALITACKEGDLTFVVSALADPDSTGVAKLLATVDDCSRTPFHYACYASHLEIVKVLLDSTTLDVTRSLNGADFQNLTPVHVACHNGHVEVLRLLLAHRGLDLTKVDERGWTALHFAASGGQVEVIKILLPFMIHPPANLRFLYPMKVINPSRIRQKIPRKKKRDEQLYSMTALHVAQIQGQLEAIKWMLAIPTFRFFPFINDLSRSPVIRSLVQSYVADEVRTRSRLRVELGLAHEDAAALFILVFSLADDLLRITTMDDKKYCKEYIAKRWIMRRFLKVARRLPLDLQMRLCNVIYGVNQDCIPEKATMPAFRALAVVDWTDER